APKSPSPAPRSYQAGRGLEELKTLIPPSIRARLDGTPQKGQRSEAIYSAALSLFELRMTADEVFTVAETCAVFEKFTARGSDALWAEILRIEAAIPTCDDIFGGKHGVLPPGASATPLPAERTAEEAERRTLQIKENVAIGNYRPDDKKPLIMSVDE